MTEDAALGHGTITPERIDPRVESFALNEGSTPENMRKGMQNLVIRARRFSEKTKEGRFRYAVELFRGGNVMDVFEEFSEDSFARALDDGFVSGSDLVTDIRRFEDATGQSLLSAGYTFNS